MKRLALITILVSALLPSAVGQKLIEYHSGMGSRDKQNPDVWILYQNVVATHDGMTLEADSAHYNTVENSFTAFRNVAITLTDTTFIYGDRLYYDGNTRVLDIWADTVVLVDGATILRANHLTYERNESMAYYDLWGHAVSRDRILDSRKGYYNSEIKVFYIYDDVKLRDSSMLLVTDYLKYDTESEIAHFETPTHIYSDSSTIYSELGDYNTGTRFAISYKRSHVDNQGRTIDSDTLYYDEHRDYGQATGNVVIVDSVNNMTCTGRYGETNQAEGFSFDAVGDLQNNTRRSFARGTLAPATKQTASTQGIYNATPEVAFGLPVAFGLGVNYQFADRLSVGTGLRYTWFSRTFVGDYYDQDLFIYDSRDIDNYQHWLGIPLNIYYDLISSRYWHFHTFAGVGAEILLSNNYRIHHTPQDVYYKDTAKYPLLFSVGAGVGLEFKMSSTVGFFFDPSLRYYLNTSKAPRSIRTVQPLCVDVEAGLRFYL